MHKPKEILLGVLDLIIPPIGNFRSNKGVCFSKMEDDLTDAQNNESVHIETLKERYSDTLRNKDKLEDKAKTNVVGITISITLIMGAANLLSSINSKYENNILVWASFALFIIAVLYMISAGILAFRMLMHENRIRIMPLDIHEDGKEDRIELCRCISDNQKYNTIRNNYVFTSYECIRNAIVLLFIVLALSAIPAVPAATSKANLQTYNSAGVSYSFLYASDTVNYAGDQAIRDLLENTVISTIGKESLTQGDVSAIGIQNGNDNLFVKFRLAEKDMVYVLIIEPYISP
ncbi:MAG: hypothetical protein VB115_10465 [Christensenellaceae bacterium]|nr:hypothetical protein [Christensenellaceae bacterium]